MILMESICCVVVTYNRKTLLKRCLNSLVTQTRLPDAILVTDNGSTDGTANMVKHDFDHIPSIKYVNLGANLGGGGGFHYGARMAFEAGYDWVWLMDDDCKASEQCLENLIGGVANSHDVYSPIVLSIEDRVTVLWGITARCYDGTLEVVTLPFNGFLIHRESLKEIGFPEKKFFIYGDDTEFNMRAKSYGKRILMVTDSIMYHPHKNKLRGLKVYKMFNNKLWTYYKLRNAIFIYNTYGYVSASQVIMFAAAGAFYLLTLNFKLLGLWLEGLRDGINGHLYVKDSLVQ